MRTGMMEMVLDHDSGEMEGYCRAGSFEGRTLSSLTETELLMLLDELRGNDPKGALLLEAYLDRSNPGWREAGSGASEGKAARSRYSGRMTREEAYEVLGLRAGAGEDEIRAAHRNLMKKVHPDQGGSDYLAARINEAKDVLLGN